MYYTIYKTTNLIDGKIYIGCHKTKDLDDDYMGSGKVLKRAIKKYGIKNFKKEILEVFDNPDNMFETESVLVNEDFVKRKDTYNIKLGGEGGFDHIDNKGKNNPFYGKKHSKKTLKNMGNAWLGKSHTKETKQKLSRLLTGRVSGFKDKQHTEKSKKKIGEANSKYQSGKGNSNYGKCWIYNLELQQSKSIPRYELKEWIEQGWIKGRKIYARDVQGEQNPL